MQKTSVLILCECPASKKIRMQIFGFARMDLEQMKEARLSGIVTLAEPPYINLNERDRTMGPESWGPNRDPPRKKKKKKKKHWTNPERLGKIFFLSLFSPVLQSILIKLRPDFGPILKIGGASLDLLIENVRTIRNVDFY